MGILASTFGSYGLEFAESFVGIMGHLVVVLPSAAYVAYGGLLMATVAIEKDPLGLIDAQKRVFLILLFIATTILLMTMGYVGWCKVGASQVDGFQGRYLAPLTPLLALAAPTLPERWLQGPEARASWVASGCGVILLIAVLETASYFFSPTG